MMSRKTRHSRFASSGRIDRFAIYGFFRLMQTPGEQLRCHLVGRAEESCKELEQAGVAPSSMIQSLIAHARRQIDQVERRLLKGETIAHDEKVFSMFEEHTRWVSKGKAGCAVELGVPVCVVEDQFQFILHHKILWEGSDTDIAVSIIHETQALHRDLPGVQLRPWVPQPRQPGAARRNARPQCVAAQGSAFGGRPRARGSANICRGQAPAPGGRVGNQQPRASRSRPGALPRRRWVCTHRCIVDTGRQPAPHRSACATAHA